MRSTPRWTASTASAPPARSGEVIKLAETIQTWQVPIIAAPRTGLTNARTEGYNRLVKHVGRIAFGFRNPDNQRRRVRWARTRRSRQITPSRHQRHC